MKENQMEALKGEFILDARTAFVVARWIARGINAEVWSQNSFFGYPYIPVAHEAIVLGRAIQGVSEFMGCYVSTQRGMSFKVVRAAVESLRDHYSWDPCSLHLRIRLNAHKWGEPVQMPTEW